MENELNIEIVRRHWMKSGKKEKVLNEIEWWKWMNISIQFNSMRGKKSDWIERKRSEVIHGDMDIVC